MRTVLCLIVALVLSSPADAGFLARFRARHATAPQASACSASESAVASSPTASKCSMVNKAACK